MMRARTVIKAFYEYHEVPLTTAKGKYGKRKKRKSYPKQMTVTQLKKNLFLKVFPKRVSGSDCILITTSYV